jgi:hypothetical protein
MRAEAALAVGLRDGMEVAAARSTANAFSQMRPHGVGPRRDWPRRGYLGYQ